MPLVHAYYDASRFDRVADLQLACAQLVPAAFNIGDLNPEGRLTPGSIRFITHVLTPDDNIGGDHVFLHIEAMYYPERDAIKDQRTKELAAALKTLFLLTEFSLWPKLDNASWYTDNPDPDFDGDLSMAAALDRARDAINHRII